MANNKMNFWEYLDRNGVGIGFLIIILAVLALIAYAK